MPNKAAHVVLCGAPNCGKSEVFNALTHSLERVGNYAGVTVAKKTSRYRDAELAIDLVDLPGVHTLLQTQSEQALDATAASTVLLSEPTTVLVNVVDASQLGRHLFLTAQLTALETPMVLAVNMMDVADKKGLCVDLKKLSQELGCPVVGLVAKKGVGIDALKKAIRHQVLKQAKPNLLTVLPPAITEYIDAPRDTSRLSVLHCINLLAGNPTCLRALTGAGQDSLQSHLHNHPKTNWVLDASAAFYQTAERLTTATVCKQTTTSKPTSHWLDRIVLNRFLGIPIFFAVIYLMFVFSINVGGAFQDFFDGVSDTIFVGGTAHLLSLIHAPHWVSAILADGLGKGINTVITFVPVIGAMFLFLALLEDSGYLSRAAFVMDRVMQKLGLPGQSFVPMIVGFGCNVPAVMGARTLRTARDRILTIVMTPFISCGARLAIFAVFAAAFFPKGGQNVIFLLYITGLLAAVGTGFLMRKTLIPGKPAPLLIELPEYHIPTFRTMRKSVWLRLKGFLWRAGRLIVPVCVLIGSLNAIPLPGHYKSESNSLLSGVGRVITPVFTPMGIQSDNWPATVGLLTGVLAKEVVIGTLNTLYSQSDTTAKTSNAYHPLTDLKLAALTIPANLKDLASAFSNPLTASAAPHDMTETSMQTMVTQFGTPLAAFSYLLFVLLYFPCVSTLAAMRREIPVAWSTFSMLWTTGLAYGVAVAVYQLGTFGEHPTQSIAWAAILIGSLISTTWGLKWAKQRGHFTISGEQQSSTPCLGCTGCQVSKRGPSILAKEN